MALVNENFLKLPGNYLFSDITKTIQSFKRANPEVRVIRLGIGDVTRPLPEVCIKAMHKAVEEMANAGTFRGYGPEQGYDFLINAIIRHDYQPRGIYLDKTEIFISDGAKSDTGNFCDILSTDNSVGVIDPIYPVYVDSNVIDGRAGDISRDGHWSNITYMPCTEANRFLPRIPDHRVDIVYLCYPNNPTGTVLTKEQLKEWVDYALANDTLILYDSAYEAFIREDNIPHSIYEIKGAKKCAVEFRSFSKTAGFTGVRCGYTVVPKELTAANLTGTWEYVSPAVMLEGDNALKNVAGNVAAGEVEKKLQSYCDKIGLKAGTFSYTFNDDNTFTCLFKGKTLKGTYTLQESDKTIQLKYGNLKLANISAQVVLTQDELALLFNADKLLDFLGKLSAVSGSATLQAVNKLTDQYEGFKVGLQLKK